MATGGQKVFSISDFKHGLDVRKSALTAPGGSLRILQNATLNEGGEIEKRFAFVPICTLPPETQYIIGHGGGLHVFGFNALSPINPGSCPVPIYPHVLNTAGLPDQPSWIIDVEPYDNGFYVCAGSATRGYCFYEGVPINDAGGNPIGGIMSRTYKSKVYRADGSGYLRFSGVGNPAMEDPANTTWPGAGFINVALNDPEGEGLTSMELYYDQMAVFARLVTQLWTLDPDPDKDTLKQILRTGTVARHSVLQFGTGDVLFLSDSGVRSLKALNAAMAASVSDVGSAIDDLLIESIKNDPNLVNSAQAIVQPIKGRYWLAISDKIYVLSYFPAGSITAWSILLPEFSVANMTVAVNMVFLRGTNNQLYLYGGSSLGEYDSCPVTIRTPHHAIDSPTASKRVQSVDIMCQGQWQVSLGMQPSNTELFELCATVQDNTYGLGTIPFAGRGSHVAAHLTHQAPGKATLNSLHFNILEGVTK
jgi:hypothetical protein